MEAKDGLIFNQTPAKAEVHAFHEGFMAFNRQYCPGDHKPFAFTVATAGGSVLGGIDGESFWGRLHVENLHVDADWRGCGVGRQLMGMAEALAREHGCRGINLDTFSFQAPGFYEKLGFVRIGEEDGYVNDYRRIYYTKTI